MSSSADDFSSEATKIIYTKCEICREDSQFNTVLGLVLVRVLGLKFGLASDRELLIIRGPIRQSQREA